MTEHHCPRCGYETSSRGRWPDRHPYAAVLFAVPVTITMVGAIAAYPLTFVPLLAVVAVVYVVDREHRRRQALAARADYEHAALLAAPVSAVRPLPRRQSYALPWHPSALLPTAPLRIGKVH